jgi:hypothetical protein
MAGSQNPDVSRRCNDDGAVTSARYPEWRDADGHRGARMDEPTAKPAEPTPSAPTLPVKLRSSEVDALPIAPDSRPDGPSSATLNPIP